MRFIRNEAIYTDASHPVCPYKIPWGKYLSDSPSVRRLRRDSSRGCFATGYTGDASKVGKANSCFATSITTPIRKCQTRASHSPKTSSFRNLSSNEVRCKFREREKVRITFPTKSDAKKITTRRLRIWRRVAVISRIRCVLPHLSRRLAFMARIYAPDFGTASKLLYTRSLQSASFAF